MEISTLINSQPYLCKTTVILKIPGNEGIPLPTAG